MKRIIALLVLAASLAACNSSSAPKEINSLITMATLFGSSVGKLPASADEKSLKFYDILEDYVEIKLTKKEEKDEVFTIEGSLTCHDMQRVGGIIQGVTFMGIDQSKTILASVDEKISKMNDYKAQ